MASRSCLPTVLAALLLSSATAPGQQTAAGPTPVIKKAEIKPTALTSGLDMYVNYCAACHGLDGKGKGPAAPALKSPVPDLTLLAKQNGGKFPTDRANAVLRFGTEISAHGSAEMPTWGPLLRSLNKSQQPEVQLRINNLIRHLESLQVQ